VGTGGALPRSGGSTSSGGTDRSGAVAAERGRRGTIGQGGTTARAARPRAPAVLRAVARHGRKRLWRPGEWCTSAGGGESGGATRAAAARVAARLLEVRPAMEEPPARRHDREHRRHDHGWHVEHWRQSWNVDLRCEPQPGDWNLADGEPVSRCGFGSVGQQQLHQLAADGLRADGYRVQRVQEWQQGQLEPITDSTNYLDTGAPATASYTVRAVIGGTEQGDSSSTRTAATPPAPGRRTTWRSRSRRPALHRRRHLAGRSRRRRRIRAGREGGADPRDPSQDGTTGQPSSRPTS